MGQESAMLQSFVIVTACVLAVVIGIYLRAVLDARNLRRLEPIPTEKLEVIQRALPMLRGLLWVLASVIGLTMLLFRDLLGG